MVIRVCKACGLEVDAAPEVCPRCNATDWLTIEQPVDSMIGRVVAGRYRLERQLGKGGMGSVYAARQVGVGNLVAVKFLNEEYSRNPDLARRFLHEARTYIRVAHPNAVTLHDFGQDTDGRLYIAMEFVEGQSLAHLLRAERRLSLADTVAITVKVAEVLGHAHGLGVVHRDLKPENVMVRRALSGFHVKVLDFGVAHLSHEGASKLTHQGTVAGTPRYMAPEQIQSLGVDARTDVYALGLLAFEMLTGQPAFDAHDMATLMLLQLNRLTPKLVDIDPALAAPPVDEVLQKATAKNRDQRYPDMAAFATAFASLTQTPAQASTAVTLPASAPAGPNASPVVPAPPTDPTFVAQPARTEMATPYQPKVPAAAKPAPVPQRRWLGPLLVGLLFLFAGGSAVALVLVRSSVAATQNDPQVTVAKAHPCPGLELYDEKYTGLSIDELERRMLALPYLLPSSAADQLKTIKAQTEAYAENQRECMYRASLTAMVANAPSLLKSQPSLWGHTRTSKELKMLFLEMPNTKGWSVDHRRGVIAFIEKNVIPSLRSEGEPDKEWWRQMYYGLQVVCFSSDDALKQLGATRPHAGDCAEFPPLDGG